MDSQDIDRDNLKHLYSDLQREYDLTLDRRKTLTGQATSLMSFAGIIETVLVGLIIALASNKDARGLLLSSQYFDMIIVLVGIGFASYILTAIFSLLAFREPKWTKVPQLPDPNPIDSIEYFFANPSKYNLKMFAIQLVDASTGHQKTNSRKYTYLKIALSFLMIGIIATTIGGLLMLMTSR